MREHNASSFLLLTKIGSRVSFAELAADFTESIAYQRTLGTEIGNMAVVKDEQEPVSLQIDEVQL